VITTRRRAWGATFTFSLACWAAVIGAGWAALTLIGVLS
jgi:hypothetical protein